MSRHFSKPVLIRSLYEHKSYSFLLGYAWKSNKFKYFKKIPHCYSSSVASSLRSSIPKPLELDKCSRACGRLAS